MNKKTYKVDIVANVSGGVVKILPSSVTGRGGRCIEHAGIDEGFAIEETL